nr:TonB-dependent receptor [Nitritalea halalkaliphila]
MRFNGIELGLAYGIREAIGNFRIDEISFSYNYIDADLNQRPELESRNTLTSLRHQVIGGVQTSYKNFVELNVKARYIERFALDPYFLLDARMDIGRLRKWGGFAEISNITNTDYIEAGFVQMPGRWFRMGLTLNLFDL